MSYILRVLEYFAAYNTTIIRHNVPSGSFMSTIIVKAIAIAGKRMITIVINFILS